MVRRETGTHSDSRTSLCERRSFKKSTAKKKRSTIATRDWTKADLIAQVRTPIEESAILSAVRADGARPLSRIGCAISEQDIRIGYALTAKDRRPHLDTPGDIVFIPFCLRMFIGIGV